MKYLIVYHPELRVARDWCIEEAKTFNPSNIIAFNQNGEMKLYANGLTILRPITDLAQMLNLIEFKQHEPGVEITATSLV